MKIKILSYRLSTGYGKVYYIAYGSSIYEVSEAQLLYIIEGKTKRYLVSCDMVTSERYERLKSNGELFSIMTTLKIS